MNDLPPYIHQATQEIDASFFSGDTFYSPERLAQIEWYIKRWEKEVELIKRQHFFAEHSTEGEALWARYYAAKSEQ